MADAVQHMNPYREAALDYKKAGWHGPLPIPHKQKNPPPTGFTGHRAPYPTVEEINEWRGSRKRQNICVRLAGVDKEHEVIGIDVDHYQSGNKDKKGGNQLQELEAKFGKLPETWTSSSRTDGFSGIRYFRVPRGLAFRGQVAKDIECISKGYRFAVVWPSIHPSGEIYWWFPPGTLPDQDGRKVWGGSNSQQLPVATGLPLLPDSWLEYLTQNKMRADIDDRIDMDSSVDEIYEWAYGLFHGDPDSDHVCRLYRNKVDKQIEDIKNEATSHDKIVKAHYNLLRLAAEGHTGWTQAIHEIEKFWAEDVISRDKRGIDEVNSEIWRSRTNALRKIKGQIDERIKIGAAPVDTCCESPGGICDVGASGDSSGQTGNSDSNVAGLGDGDSPPPDDPLSDVPRGPIKPASEYDMNDDGNALHLVEMFSNLKTGVSFRFADGYGWIVWHQGKGDGEGKEQPHWVTDRDGDQEMRRLWWKVKDRQKERIEVLKQDYVTKLNAYDAQQPGTSKADVEVAKALYREWKTFAEKSGNNYTAANAIRAARSKPGIQISINNLDKNPLLLGVANGVLELASDNIRLRPAMPDDYITLNTGVAYGRASDLAKRLWNEYLDTFLPDLETRNITQIAMGYALIGGNPQKKIIVLKGGTDTGKSTMLSAIQAALGDYAGPINETVFQSSQFSEVLVKSMNKRVVACSEFDSSIELSASVIKRLTGEDNISQAIKYSNETVDGKPQFVMMLATNNVPKITGADKALENRLFIIPFNEKPKDIDRMQGNVISSVCASAVLEWLVDGYLQYSRIKMLPTSAAIQTATDEFMSDIDDTAMFLNEALIKHDRFGQKIDWKHEPEWCIKREDLYRHYKSWCDINEIPERYRLSPHMLTKRLRSLGVPDSGNVNVSVNGTPGRYWYGVKVRKARRMTNVFPMRTVSEADEVEKEEKEERGNGSGNRSDQ